MGRKSRAKEERQAMARTQPQLAQKLEEQLELLSLLGERFDAGHTVTALLLAVTIRTLVHDGRTAHSLLGQLGLKETLRFCDTALHVDPRNLMPTPGLVVLQSTVGIGPSWVAPLSDLSPPRIHSPELFTPWWNSNITKDSTGATWSRRDFVLYLANKEGGAHVDPREPDASIAALEANETIGWVQQDPIAGTVSMLNGPIPPSVRQIAFEVETTLRGR